MSFEKSLLELAVFILKISGRGQGGGEGAELNKDIVDKNDTDETKNCVGNLKFQSSIRGLPVIIM